MSHGSGWGGEPFEAHQTYLRLRSPRHWDPYRVRGATSFRSPCNPGGKQKKRTHDAAEVQSTSPWFGVLCVGCYRTRVPCATTRLQNYASLGAGTRENHAHQHIIGYIAHSIFIFYFFFSANLEVARQGHALASKAPTRLLGQDWKGFDR